MAEPHVWKQLAAPIPTAEVQWRQDGRPTQRDGKFYARFVAYVDAQFVRERLDAELAGQWTTSLELLPPMAADSNGVVSEEPCAFKCRLTVANVSREDVGTGKDYKTAASDAFKRAAVRFGIAHELYAYEQNWVQVDGDGKFAKPVEDPGDAYARRMARSGNGNGSGVKSANAVESSRHQRVESGGQVQPTVTTTPARQQAAPESAPDNDEPAADDAPSCPKCGSGMYDNRLTKRNPKAPNYKCRSRSCDGVIWPPKDGDGAHAVSTSRRPSSDYDPSVGF